MFSVQVLLDCAIIVRQFNRWKAGTAAIRNTNNEENFLSAKMSTLENLVTKGNSTL